MIRSPCRQVGITRFNFFAFRHSLQSQFGIVLSILSIILSRGTLFVGISFRHRNYSVIIRHVLDVESTKGFRAFAIIDPTIPLLTFPAISADPPTDTA